MTCSKHLSQELTIYLVVFNNIGIDLTTKYIYSCIVSSHHNFRVFLQEFQCSEKALTLVVFDP